MASIVLNAIKRFQLKITSQMFSSDFRLDFKVNVLSGIHNSKQQLSKNLTVLYLKCKSTMIYT